MIVDLFEDFLDLLVREPSALSKMTSGDARVADPASSPVSRSFASDAESARRKSSTSWQPGLGEYSKGIVKCRDRTASLRAVERRRALTGGSPVTTTTLKPPKAAMMRPASERWCVSTAK
jgi:hypothetical protein